SSSVHLSAAEAFPTTASAIALANKIDFMYISLSFVSGLIAAHTAPHPARHALQSTAWDCGRSVALSARFCLALASNAHGIEPGPLRVAGPNTWEAAHLPTRLTLPLASGVTRANVVAVDLRRSKI